MKRMGRVEGKVVLVTGAGQGQGRAHSVRLAEEGAIIVATDICSKVSRIAYDQASEADLDQTKQLVEKAGGRCLALTADVRQRSDLEDAVNQATTEFGRLDVVVANAGLITFHKSSLDIDDELYDVIVDTNQRGVWNTIQACAPVMISGGKGGSIIITSSCSGIRGHAGYAHYAGAKHAVVGFMKAFANELARYRIRVNTIHPTGVSSPGMGSDISAGPVYQSEPLFKLAAMNLLPDLDSEVPSPGSPELVPVAQIHEIEVANAVVWLASDEARYVTGVELPIDAGCTSKP